jgi:hypothetical protein
MDQCHHQQERNTASKLGANTGSLAASFPPLLAGCRSNTYPSSEIGLKSNKNVKWETYNGNLYRKGDYAKSLSPYLPAEGYYTILQTIHKDHGHCGRDKLYLHVKARTSSISKDFCAAYAECCCYSMWEKVSVLINHFTPSQMQNELLMSVCQPRQSIIKLEWSNSRLLCIQSLCLPRM